VTLFHPFFVLKQEETIPVADGLQSSGLVEERLSWTGGASFGFFAKGGFDELSLELLLALRLCL